MVNIRKNINNKSMTIHNNHNRCYNRPVKLGVSISNGSELIRNREKMGGCCYYGTMGFLIKAIDKYYVVSCSHVLALNPPEFSSNEYLHSSTINDRITQPGTFSDTIHGDSKLVIHNSIATLIGWERILPDKQCVIDVGIAEILYRNNTPLIAIDNFIEKIGFIEETRLSNVIRNYLPFMNKSVKKSGAGSGVTAGIVKYINTSLLVKYKYSNNPESFNVWYNDLILIEGNDFATYGDSGAIVVEQLPKDSDVKYPKSIGLLFAGNGHYFAVLMMKKVLKKISDLLMIQSEAVKIIGKYNDYDDNPVDIENYYKIDIHNNFKDTVGYAGSGLRLNVHNKQMIISIFINTVINDDYHNVNEFKHVNEELGIDNSYGVEYVQMNDEFVIL